ncbi:MAG: nucleotide sugar dehydrogenase [Oligoflexia bacterium]|nr:nucleotide sugar dehydrogenase [Oligoflexia bacterium]
MSIPINETTRAKDVNVNANTKVSEKATDLTTVISFLQKIKNRQVKVGVIGLGYVGLPLAIEFARAGFNVVGVDIAKEKVDQLSRGESYILDVKDEDVRRFVVEEKKLQVSSDYSMFMDVDSISITVPTPLRKTKDPDISFIVSAMDSLIPVLANRKNFMIVLESTTYPGTTRELVYDRLCSEYKYLRAGENIFVAFSPERVDPGNPIYHTKNTPKVIGGITKHCSEVVASLYGQVIEKIVMVGSTEEAEMVKLLENTFRAVNIALVNELLLMCDRMNINVWRVIEAAATKPFGFMPFYPGPGIGGHCIPLDPLYLSWKAKSFDFYNRFIELASDINGNMPRFTVQKLQRILNDHGKCLKGARVLILGMSYKKDIDDVRESPGLEIYRILKEEYGVQVSYHDPHVPSFIYHHGDIGNQSETTGVQDGKIYSSEICSDIIRKQDCILLLVNHTLFDYQIIAEHAQLILDTRNAFKSVSGTRSNDCQINRVCL